MHTIKKQFNLQSELRRFQEQVYKRFQRIERVVVTSTYIEYKVAKY